MVKVTRFEIKSDDDLAKIQKLMRRTSPMPWRARWLKDRRQWSLRHRMPGRVLPDAFGEMARMRGANDGFENTSAQAANAQFIAMSTEWVPELIRALRQAWAERDDLRERLDKLGQHPGLPVEVTPDDIEALTALIQTEGGER